MNGKIMKNISKLKKLKEKAKEEGEAFIATLTGKQLRDLGFGALWEPEEEFWMGVESVDIYLQYDNDKYKLKYIFNEDTSDVYYEDEKEIGSETFWDAVSQYMEAGEKEE